MVDMQDYAIIFLLWLGLIISIQASRSRRPTKPHNLPPSPRGLPIIGHMHLLGPIAHQALHNFSTRYGPLVYFRVGSIPNVLVSSSEFAEEIVRTNEFNFLNRPRNANINYITYGSSDFAMTPYGPYWKFMKKMCMTQLLSSQTLDKLRPIRRDELGRFLRLMLKKAEEGEPVNIAAHLMEMTNNIISGTAFRGRHSGEQRERDDVVKVVKELNELGGMVTLSEAFWFLRKFDLQGCKKRLKQARDRYDNIIERIIKEHEDAKKEKGICKGSEDAKNLLDILLEIYEDEDAEIKLTRENIKGFLLNIIGAGTDTSALTIEWGLAELLNHPNAMQKARQEIGSIIGESRIVEEVDLANLPYLQAIMMEILRLHPAGPIFARESTGDCTIGGYSIPANTRIIVNVWSIGRDHKNWEEPLEFRPERFLNQEGGVDNEMWQLGKQHFRMLPFGTGRRSCPGQKLALSFVPTALAAMIQCFDFKTTVPIDMTEGAGLTLPRANPLVCIPVARLKPFPSL